jgi:hypothetical protein
MADTQQAPEAEPRADKQQVSEAELNTDTQQVPEAEPRAEYVTFDEKPRRNMGKIVAVIACAVAVLSLVASVVIYLDAKEAVATAQKKQHEAEARPPKVVTKTVTKTVTKKVPVYGRSVLMGVFASGAIQTGVYDESNAQDLWIGLRDGTRRAYLPE